MLLEIWWEGLPDEQRGVPEFRNAAPMEGRSMLRPYY